MVTVRKVVRVVGVVVIVCLLLRIVVWQPFRNCWRLIIARVSEMHVAYHKTRTSWVISSSEHHNNPEKW